MSFENYVRISRIQSVHTKKECLLHEKKCQEPVSFNPYTFYFHVWKFGKQTTKNCKTSKRFNFFYREVISWLTLFAPRKAAAIVTNFGWLAHCRTASDFKCRLKLCRNPRSSVPCRHDHLRMQVTRIQCWVHTLQGLMRLSSVLTWVLAIDSFKIDSSYKIQPFRSCNYKDIETKD